MSLSLPCSLLSRPRYQCIFCWETFVTYYNLKTHQRAFHGISPGLLASEKTPNGGYKPKLNTLKLYRLLPMRAAKRPYKTYSQAAPDAPLSPSLNTPAPVAMPASPPPGPPPAPQPGPPPSVIAFAHPAPSVIVHGRSSSGGAGVGAATAGGAQAASVITYTAPPRPPKKREYPPPPPQPAATPSSPHHRGRPGHRRWPGHRHGGGQGPQPTGWKDSDLHGQASRRDWRGWGSPCGAWPGPLSAPGRTSTVSDHCAHRRGGHCQAPHLRD